jgi:hypothetical protein
MIHYGDVSFRYDPWPFGVARNLFSPDRYDSPIPLPVIASGASS